MQSILSVAAELLAQHKPCAMATVIRTSGSVPRRAGSRMLVGTNGELLAGTVGGGVMEDRACKVGAQVIRTGKPTTVEVKLIDPCSGDAGVCGGVVELFIEPLLTTPTLLVIGAGHVGRALVHVAKWCGFRTVITDDRTELCTPQFVPNADVYLPGALREELAQIELTPQTYVALVTRSFPMDVDILPTLLASPVKYIGVIGSQRRWQTAKQALLDQGLSESDLSKIHAPIGVEIGAETPEEIAISIAAEMIGVMRAKQS